MGRHATIKTMAAFSLSNLSVHEIVGKYLLAHTRARAYTDTRKTEKALADE